MPIKIKNTYTGYKDPYKKFDEICEKHNIKPRANAVLAYELLLTFSPEMSGQINNKEFLRKSKMAGNGVSERSHFIGRFAFDRNYPTYML